MTDPTALAAATILNEIDPPFEVVDRATILGGALGGPATPAVDGRQEQPTATADRLAPSLIDFDAAFWDGADDAEEFLVAPFLARGRSHLLYASAKTGKSLLALWIAARAALGRAVLDRPDDEPVRVLYCDLEMTRSDVRERMSDMGFGPDDDLSNLRYYSLPSLAALDTPQGGAEFVELARHHEAELVVIDTISRVVVGEENSNDTTQNFAKFTGTPLKAAGIAVLRVDHAGKEVTKGARGGSSKVDDVDIVWQLIGRDAGSFSLIATHRRINWVPAAIELKQETDPLGYSLAERAWVAGTEAAARTLDRLGVDPAAGKPKARTALREAGLSMSNEVLASAIRWRKSGTRLVNVEEIAP